jgi:hypothetical protein
MQPAPDNLTGDVHCSCLLCHLSVTSEQIYLSSDTQGPCKVSRYTTVTALQVIISRCTRSNAPAYVQDGQSC